MGLSLLSWMHSADGLYCRRGPVCDIEKPIGSPNVNGYRTKCEFTIGTDLDGKPTVGFLLGLYKLGVTAVLDPSDCLNVPDVAKRIARAMQVCIRYKMESVSF